MAHVKVLILAELTVQEAKTWDLLWWVGHRRVAGRNAMLTAITVAAAIVSVCLMIHVGGILLMAEWLLHRRETFERNASRRQFVMLIIKLFGGILLLHLIQTTLWAVFYYARNLFSDFETSLYFSMVSFTTIGYGDVLLPRRWRLLGVIEGFSGVVLCGVSTAFIFAVINGLLQFRLRQIQTNDRTQP